jgi:predicted HicB family RNase H-like nuclease
MQEAVDDYLEHGKERGKTPDKPYSGKFLFRTTADLHRAIATEAAAERMSINEWMDATVRTAVRERWAAYKTGDDPDE